MIRHFDELFQQHYGLSLKEVLCKSNMAATNDKDLFTVQYDRLVAFYLKHENYFSFTMIEPERLNIINHVNSEDLVNLLLSDLSVSFVLSETTLIYDGRRYDASKDRQKILRSIYSCCEQVPIKFAWESLDAIPDTLVNVVFAIMLEHSLQRFEYDQEVSSSSTTKFPFFSNY